MKCNDVKEDLIISLIKSIKCNRPIFIAVEDYKPRDVTLLQFPSQYSVVCFIHSFSLDSHTPASYAYTQHLNTIRNGWC